MIHQSKKKDFKKYRHSQNSKTESTPIISSQCAENSHHDMSVQIIHHYHIILVRNLSAKVSKSTRA